MKRIYLHILVPVMATFTLAACDTEGIEPEAVRDYPTFSATIEGIRTRAYDTVWEQNDKIGIYCGDIVNLSHTHQGNGSFTVTDPTKQIVFTDNKPMHFFAYYPYSTPASSGTNKGKIVFTSNINQAKQKDFDFLWAEADGSKADPDVNFNFTHKMCKISFVFMNGDDMDVSTITSYSLSGLSLKGLFDPLTGTCATTTTSTSSASVDLSKVKVNAGEPVTPIIVFPQKLKSNTLTLSVTAAAAGIGTVTGSITFKENEIKAGNNYQFVVKVSKTGLKVASAIINDWAEVDRGDTWVAM